MENIKLVENIERQINLYKREKKKIFISSSFQSHSIPLLHIISKIDSSIPVYFIDTGFHFPETYLYKEQITKLLKITVNSISSPISKIHQRDIQGRFLFCSNNEYCCHINKVLPLEPVLMNNDVWITGVRSDQNENRKKLNPEEEGPFDTIRFHPMLQWSAKMIWDYRNLHALPPHPLEDKGYISIGCTPCTQKATIDNRSGRWAGLNKTECGLHTELIK